MRQDLDNRAESRSYGSRRPGAAEFIRLATDHVPPDSALERIVEQYSDRGFALFEFFPGGELGRALVGLAEALALGSPFVPPVYHGPMTAQLYDASGVNVIEAPRAEVSGSAHPGFQSRGALEFHTDGTLQLLGLVPTAALVCATPAGAGGESTLFDGPSAFASLAGETPHLAEALLHPAALARRATVNGSQETAVGPVFALRNGEILSRYSVTPRDQWNTDEIRWLREAYDALWNLAQPGSRYYSEIRLGAGQGILIANDKLSHGRTAFQDDPGAGRQMLRALFTRRPIRPGRE
jgi:hypothetical protein